jgi:hypothetical protein
MGVITIDLHLHTNFSDGKLPLHKVVDLCGNAGLDAIAVTDHLCTTDHLLGKSARFLDITLTEKNWPTYFRELEKQRNRAWRDYKMLVFTGVEYTHNTFFHKRNAHMLAIDVKEFISPALGELEWLKVAREQGALTVAAHPLKIKDASSQTYYLLENQKIFSPFIDLWEVANARTFWRQMLKTPFSLIASSDLHVASRWASWRTEINCEKDPEAIKAYLKDPSSQRNFVFMYGKKDEIKNRITQPSLRDGGPDVFSNHYDSINTYWASSNP